MIRLKDSMTMTVVTGAFIDIRPKLLAIGGGEMLWEVWRQTFCYRFSSSGKYPENLLDRNIGSFGTHHIPAPGDVNNSM